VASPTFAAELEGRTRTPVVVLEQATDPRRFYPDPDGAHARELVYVANSRNVLRPIVRDLLPTSRDLAIYGANWEGLIDTRLVVAEHVPNDELRRVYSSAAIVLNDHWDDMRAHGFASNRIYDALACGAVVVSDDVPGLERFGDAVVTYRSPEELEPVIDALLADPAGRAERGRAGMALVRAEHTFDRRADVLLAQIAALIEERPFPVRVRPAPAGS
jgi:spore maturation protein CgeB